MDEQLQQQLWDYAYGLLSDAEAEELELRIGSEPDVARAYAEVRLKADMLGDASRVVEPIHVLHEAKVETAANGRAGVSPFQQATPSRPLTRGNWFVAAAASFVAVCALLGAGRRAEPQRVAVNPSNIERYTEVTVPAAMEAGARNVVLIRSLNADQEPGPTDVVYRILDDQLRSQYESEKISAPATGALVETPALDDDAKFIEVFSKDSPSLRIPINTVAQSVTARLTPDRFRYEPGDKIQFRLQTLSRFSREPAANIPSSTELLDGSGEVVAVAKTMTNNEGVVAGELSAPASGGKYTLKSLNDDLLFAPAKSEIIVAESFQTELPAFDLRFARDSYEPGDEVAAELQGKDALAQASDRKVEAWTQIDGIERKLNVESAPSGDVRMRFKLPDDITHEARLSIRTGGATGRTIVKTIPVAGSEREIAFLPEGGQLVNGVTNRVFFASQSAGQWAYLKGKVQDDLGNQVAAIEVTHEGRGAFLMRPEQGRTYQLKVDGPGKHVAELPKATNDGVAVIADPAIFAAGQPVRFLTLGAPVGRQMLAVAECRGVTVAQKRWVSSGDSEGDTVRLDIPSEADGVIRVTVLEMSGQEWRPKAERLVFRRGSRRLEMTFAQRYDESQKDVLLADLTVKDENGNGVEDAVIGAWARPLADEDSLGRETANMAAYYALASELNSAADVEKINTAAGLADEQASEYLELLLGADGWRRFAAADEDNAAPNAATPPPADSTVAINNSFIEENYSPPRTFDNKVTLSTTQAAAVTTAVSTPWRSLVIAGCMLGLFVILLMGLLRMAESRVCVPAFAMASVILLSASMMRFQPTEMIASRLETTADSSMPAPQTAAPNKTADNATFLDAEVEETRPMFGAELESAADMIEEQVDPLAESDTDASPAMENALGGRRLPPGGGQPKAQLSNELKKSIKRSQTREPQPGSLESLSEPSESAESMLREKAIDAKTEGESRDEETKNSERRGGMSRETIAGKSDGQAKRAAVRKERKSNGDDASDAVDKTAGFKSAAKPQAGGRGPTRQRRVANLGAANLAGGPAAPKAMERANADAGGVARPLAAKASAANSTAANSADANPAAANSAAASSVPTPMQPAPGARSSRSGDGVDQGVAERPREAPSEAPDSAPGRSLAGAAGSAGRPFGGQAGFGGGAAQAPAGDKSGMQQAQVKKMQVQLQQQNIAPRYAETELRRLAENTFLYRRQLANLNIPTAIDSDKDSRYHYWNPIARTGSAGKLTFAIPNPPGAPARRLVADGLWMGRLGDAEMTLEARGGLLASLTTPSAVTYGDQVRAPLMLFNNSSQPLDVDIRLAEAAGVEVEEADREFKVRLEPGQRGLRRDIRITPTANAQDARLAYRVTSGNEEQQLVQSLRIDPRGYPVDRFYAGVVESKRDLVVQVPPNQPTEISLRAFPTLKAELQDALENPTLRSDYDPDSAKQVADISLDYYRRRNLTADELSRAAEGLRDASRGFVKEQATAQQAKLSPEMLKQLTESESLDLAQRRRLYSALQNVSEEDRKKVAEFWRSRYRNALSSDDKSDTIKRNASVVAENSAAAIAMKGKAEYVGERREALEKVVARRQRDGGFGKPDDTALALQALADNETELYKVAPDAKLAVKVNGAQVAAKPLNSPQPVQFQRLQQFTKPGENQLSLAIGEGNVAPFLGLARTWAPNAPKGREDLNLQVQLSRGEAKLGDSIEVRVVVENRGKEPAALVAAISLPGGLFLRPQRLEELKRAKQVDHYESARSNVKLLWRALPPGERRELVFDAVAGAAGRYTSTPAKLYRQDDQATPTFAEPSTIVIR